jgi:predicted tellurium resistance membrane protein TerC
MFYLLEMPNFASVEVWVALLTLTFLEIVLGVDNIVFISIASNKLPEGQRPRARRLGLIMAMLFRVLMLLGISALIKMQNPLFHFDASWFTGAFTGQSIILLVGGLFLIYKATDEIHHKLERSNGDNHGGKAVKATMVGVVTQIALMDIVFSFDSVLTAVGLADNVLVMIIAVVVAILVMMLFADPVSEFVNKHPTVQMLGLSFLLLIGFMLIAEGAHLGHFVIAGQEIGSMPKGYLYFAIAFSLLVEFLNMRLRKTVSKPVKLMGLAETARKEGIIQENPKND